MESTRSEPDENKIDLNKLQRKEEQSETEQSISFVKRLKDRLFNTRKALSSGLDRIFIGKRVIDEQVLEDLEELLITSDIGVQTTMKLIERISRLSSDITNVSNLKKALKDEIRSLVQVQPDGHNIPLKHPHIVMVVGGKRCRENNYDRQISRKSC